jgi:hypothetical protein
MATVRILRQSSQMPAKIQAIKLVRQVTNMGLKEAKDMVEMLPGTFEVAPSYNPNIVINELISCGYDAELVNELTANLTDSEQAFKVFLIALINDGEYDQVVTFIKTKKHGSVAGQAARNLELM